MATDEVRVVAVGTVAFAFGLVLTLVLHSRLDDHGHGDWVWIMAAGLFLGLVGLRHLRGRARGAGARPPRHPEDPAPPAAS